MRNIEFHNREKETQEILAILDSRPTLIKDNILFLDPDTGIIKPQSKLNLLAIRKVLEDWVQ